MEISDDILPIGWSVLQYIIGPFVVQPTRSLTISCNNHHFPFRYWRWLLTFKIFQVSQNVVGVQAERMSFGLGVASSPSWNPDTNFAFLLSALRLVRLARDVNSVEPSPLEWIRVSITCQSWYRCSGASSQSEMQTAQCKKQRSNS